jgi:AcrR family transcriptional regulator
MEAEMAKRMKPELRKRQILEHFYEVLIEEGIEGASIGKIASRMEVHKSLISHYFSKKEDMVIELIELIIQRYEQTIVPRLKEIEDPKKRLEAFLNEIFSLPWKRLFGLPSSKPPNDEAFYAFYYLTFRNEAISKRFKEMYLSMRETFAREIKAFAEEAGLEIKEPDRIADLFVVLSEGLNICERMRDDDQQSEEFRSYVTEQAMALLLNGERR